MSYHTLADEARDRAAKHIKEAIKELSTILVEQCDGYDEYNGSYLEKLGSAFATLIALRGSL